MPAGVARTVVTVWSNGLALDADIYRPNHLHDDAALPAVVLCHGWGGSKLTAERYAALFASVGMITLSFTQSSWFGAGSPLQLVGETPQLDATNEASARVRFIRALVAPFAWVAHFRAALDYLGFGLPPPTPKRATALPFTLPPRARCVVCRGNCCRRRACFSVPHRLIRSCLSVAWATRHAR